MSYHSTVDYYVGINDAVAARLGGHSSAPLLLSSLDFAPVRALQEAEDWPGAGRLLARHGRLLAEAGADAILICTNLMHKVADEVEAAAGVPLLHMVDAVAQDARRQGIERLGILGTRWTMTESFYADRLRSRGVEPVQASATSVATTDRIIWSELTRGVVTEPSRHELLGVVSELRERGADGVVLGCTELPLILDAEVCAMPVVDSTRAHVAAAVQAVLGPQQS